MGDLQMNEFPDFGTPVIHRMLGNYHAQILGAQPLTFSQSQSSLKIKC